MPRIHLDASRPDPAALECAAAAILSGAVVACPTETFYGLAVDPRRREAVDALYRIKQRRSGQPLGLVAADVSQVDAVIGVLPEMGRRLARQFWPGPLTLIVAAPAELTAALHSTTGRVAVRVSSHPIARALPAAVGFVLTSTSANRSGEPAPVTPDQVECTLGDAVDLVLDAGPATGGLPSTLVDVTGVRPVLVRAGAVAWRRVLESLAIP